MNPQTVKTQADLMKVREAYLANLEAEQRNLKKTADAVSILQQTGQPPIAPQDTRTISEKLMDIEKLKIKLRKLLLDLTDGQQTSLILNDLSDEEIQALSIVFGDIAPKLKAKYVNGIPAPIFLEYVRRYLKDYNINLGLASGLQGVIASELKLTRDMMQRILPSKSTLDELVFTVKSAPDSPAKTAVLEALDDLIKIVPNIDDIMMTQKQLSEVELSNLASLIKDATDPLITNSQAQKLSKDIISALRGGSQKETQNVLNKTLQSVKMQQEELDKLAAISEALRQEQEEQFKPKTSKLEPSNVNLEIQKIATILMSKPKIVNVATGEKYYTKSGIEKNVTQQELLLVPDARQKLTASKLNLANEIYNLDVMDVDEIAENDFSEEAMTKYWEYLSLRDFKKLLSDDQKRDLVSLSKDELKQRIMQGKMSGLLSFDIVPIEEATAITKGKIQRRKDLRTSPAQAKAIAKQQTATNIGGVSPNVNYEEKAGQDFTDGKLMNPIDFDTLSLDDLNEYLTGLFNTNAVSNLDLADEFKTYLNSVHLDKRDGLVLLEKTKIINGMGMKKSKKASKNIVFGCGLSKTVSKTKPKKEFSEKIDFTEGIPLDKSYVPFGKYVIHKHKLTGGILQIRTVKGGSIPKIPTLGISPVLGKIIKKMMGGALPTYDEMTSLNDEEKNTLYKVFKLSQVDKTDLLPSPDKTKEEQEMNRFQILKGQIQAGNNNTELIKEFKCLLLKFISGGKVPRGQGMEIMCELMSLGY